MRHEPVLDGPFVPASATTALELARAHLERHFTETITLDELARVAGRSKYHLARQFRRAHGLTPHAYVLALRVRRAEEMLRAGCTVVEVASTLGFCDHSHFLRVFKRLVGMTPGAFARAARAEAPAAVPTPSSSAG